ncbi:glyoxalase domain-containing protein 4 [Holotrichia oblita]|uniref:Glyoxalase domain-containing protein 4 n=2 Tax=Holotrichia oblita TaxID=644536 RepID=A0ACB9T4T2_HOLOL|nr:glyoxalase domain-containing protein 4 [Holotrichia oblita]KAI4461793.1 glyoxalase domain-containing protein 4 [Holotrichia oblita]
MSTPISGRALHYVFKIGDRGSSARFYREILGMKVLRHEEFTEGCDAACNGPYANRWSKTMVGYGPEDDHFVFELTYNYPVKSYEKGNEFISITIKSRESLERARKNKWPILPGNILEAPGGFQYQIIDEPQPTDKDPVEKVTLACSNLQKSIDYWNGLLGLEVFAKDLKKRNAVFGFKSDEAKLELQQIDGPINRAKAYGRIAFSCPRDQQPTLHQKITEANAKILTPLMSLDTPGKATVRVIVLADPDGHEICFVDDESFRQLSEYQPDDEKILDRFLKKDEAGQLQKPYGKEK